ncbi:hypothetical protein [Kitasatospora sp. NPDC008115]|uniref:hypothetical protein n=1 Tax=Kitasatospora sp. NPDC008115 TaxID=3364022 RepID=UPI0036F1370A
MRTPFPLAGVGNAEHTRRREQASFVPHAPGEDTERLDRIRASRPRWDGPCRATARRIA